jgi:hypothetical protein
VKKKHRSFPKVCMGRGGGSSHGHRWLVSTGPNLPGRHMAQTPHEAASCRLGAIMRNAKLLLVAVVSAFCSVGCAIQLHNGGNDTAYDFSDYTAYDKPFGTSPNYRDAAAPEAHDRPVSVARATTNIMPAKAELPSREPVRVYDDATAVSETAGVANSRPSKATAFATHAASVLGGERSEK